MNDIDVALECDELWDFYEENKERCKEEIVEVARSPSHVIYITDCYGYLQFIVEPTNGSEKIKRVFGDPDSAFDWVLGAYDEYIYGVKKDSHDNDNIDSIIYDREEELTYAIEDLVSVFAEDGDEARGLTNSDFDELIDEIGILLTKHGIPVYRPTLVEDGEDIEYIEYPYERTESEK